MQKATSTPALSLILLEPTGAAALPSSSALLSQLRGTLRDFPAVLPHRASTAAETVSWAEGAEAALILCEIREPNDAVQLLAALKILRTAIAIGRVKVLVKSGLPSAALLEKLKMSGCFEAASGELSEEALREIRVWVESKQLSRAVARLPARKVTPLGLAFLVSEWMSRAGGQDLSGMAHLFCAALSASCSGLRVELWGRQDGRWVFLGSSDFFSEPLGRFLENSEYTEPEVPEGREVSWIRTDDHETVGALVFERGGKDASAENEPQQLFQVASRLARGLVA